MCLRLGVCVCVSEPMLELYRVYVLCANVCVCVVYVSVILLLCVT